MYPELPILIVDDEEHFLTSLRANLRVRGITHVECCQDSRDVLPMLAKTQYSLILLDILMPHIRGDVLLPEIQKNYPNLEVMYLTATECMNSKKSPGIQCINKSVDLDQLVVKIKAAINAKNPAKDTNG